MTTQKNVDSVEVLKGMRALMDEKRGMASKIKEDAEKKMQEADALVKGLEQYAGTLTQSMLKAYGGSSDKYMGLYGSTILPGLALAKELSESTDPAIKANGQKLRDQVLAVKTKYDTDFGRLSEEEIGLGTYMAKLQLDSYNAKRDAIGQLQAEAGKLA